MLSLFLRHPAGMPRPLLEYWFGASDTSIQSIPNQRGTVLPLQRGSAAGVDTNDPTLTGGYAQHTTDDYFLSPTVSPSISMAGNWSLYFAGMISGSAAAGIISIADPTVAVQHQTIQQSALGLVNVQQRQDASTVTTSGTLAVPANAYVMLGARKSGGTITLKRFDTGTTVSLASPIASTAARLGIGAIPRSTVVSIIDSLRSVALVAYASVPSERQEAAIYRYMKGRALGLPTPITVL